MFDRLDPKALFLAHLDWIEDVAAMVCHKHGMWGDDAEDFASSAKVKLMEDDYAAIRKYRGESEFTSYLTAVIVRHFLACRRERRGRWRNSAAARRHGPLAMKLEALVYRDGYRLAQAGEKLRTAGETTASDAELVRLLAELPRRAPLRPGEAGPAHLDSLSGPGGPDDPLMKDEAAVLRGRVMEVLRRARDRLDSEERAIVQMRYADGYSIADVARALHLEQKPLYRRLPRLCALMRSYMVEAGVSEDDIREILADDEKESG